MNIKSLFIKIIFLFTFLTSLNAVNIWSTKKCTNTCNTLSCINSEKSNVCLIREKINFPAKTLLKGFKDGVGVIKHIIETKKLTLYGSHSEAKYPFKTWERFKELPIGFSFNYKPGTRVNAGYLLISKFAAEKDGAPSTELWDLNEQKAVHEQSYHDK